MRFGMVVIDVALQEVLAILERAQTEDATRARQTLGGVE